MALLTANSVTSTATTVTAAAVSASDTIAGSDIGENGAMLNVINGGGGSINVVLVDPMTTPAGNTATAPNQAVANGTDRWFLVTKAHVNPTTGVATVTFSGTTSVTYKLLRGPAR